MAYQFTNKYVIGGVSGDAFPPPQCGRHEMTVPYIDTGYHGGCYWAILPKNISRESACDIFEQEDHLTQLVAIGWDKCITILDSDELRGLMIHHWNGDVQ